MKRLVLAGLGLMAMGMGVAPASAVTNLVLNGGFSSAQTASRQASTDSGTQYVTNWTNCSTGSACTYGSGTDQSTTAGYNMLIVPGSNSSNIATNQYGNITLAGVNSSSTTGHGTYGQDNLAGGGGNYIASDGGNFNASALEQQITGLAVGKTYALSFDWAGTQQTGSTNDVTNGWLWFLSNSLNYNKNDNPNLTIYDAGVTSSPDRAAQTFLPWSKATFYFVADSASEYLNFFATGTSGNPPFSLLDNVSLIEAPEPASWMMMIVGFGFVGLAMRRRPRGTAAA